jgi:chemotaxis protein CheD
VVGIAELKTSADPAVQLVTHALGSCLGVTVWDPVAGIGGMLHVMLHSSAIDPERGRSNPARFVDTGVPALFRSCYALGARKERMVTRVAGGASMVAGKRTDRFQTGRRNLLALKRILWRNGVLILDEDVGGAVARTMYLDVGSGEVTVRSGRSTRTLRSRAA